MPLTQQEVRDRLEIADLLVRYCEAVDGRDWDALDELFTADAHVDLTATGGRAGDLGATKAFLAAALAGFAATQHMLGTGRVEVYGDTARARTPCHNPLVVDTPGGRQLWLVGLWYVDELVRTPAGWRLRRRRQECCYRTRMQLG